MADELKQKRKQIKSTITRHQTAVSQFKSGDNIYGLEIRMCELNELFKNYNEVQSQLETLNAVESVDIEALDRESNKERSKVEMQYYNLLAEIKSLLIENGPATSTQSTSSVGQPTTVINITKNTPDPETVSNLKPIPLPSFSGKYTNWYNFYDSFKSLVHDDNSLSDIRKFHYLRGCLEGEALNAIESLGVSGANYASAIDLLKKRFENNRLIVQDHVINILHTPTISKLSHLELRTLLDTVNNNIAALKVLKLPVDSWDALLIEIICEKLDFATKKEWQAVLQKEVPKYSDFNSFLEKKCQVLEAVNNIKPASPTIHSKNITNQAIGKETKHFKNNFKPPHRFASHAISKFNCPICKQSHLIYNCTKFQNMNIIDRIKQVEDLNLCHNCLRNNHNTGQCKSNYSCRHCNQRHNTLLHLQETTANTSLHALTQNTVLLSTLIILIKDKYGSYQKCRALLDMGSQVNLITASFCNKLGLETKPTSIYISGINQSLNQISKKVSMSVRSQVENFSANLDCFIVPHITGITPPTTFDKAIIEIPSNITLADPNFNIASDVDLLIGSGLYWNLIIGTPIQFKPHHPYFQQTRFGWVLGGDLTQVNSNLSCNLLSVGPDINLEKQVSKFWSQEEIDSKVDWSFEEQECETHFVSNTYRAPCGKFVVKLPFKQEISLGESREQSMKRFLNLEKKLLNHADLKISYQKFMREYFNLKHMELVPVAELENPKAYYLPHFAVFKNTIEGPKIRVVFDAAAKSSNGLCLNDNLMTGPTIQQDLFSILCRFRTHQFVIAADITKMYRMILINKNDADFQRILWRENPNQPIQTYRLTTVTYGTTSAPFLAVRSLHQLALDVRETDPLTSDIIIRDFYMDDLLTGSNSFEETKQIKNRVSTVLAGGGFNLCKWASNNSELLEHNSHEQSSVNLNKDDDIKILGFYWNCQADELKYKFDITYVNQENITKRSILSTVARIFDPLGLINPVIVKAKILLQNIWVLKINWDEPVTIDIKQKWLRFLNELVELNNFRIFRKVITIHPTNNIELHAFSDASTKAYGACVYLKATDGSGDSSINLLCAKSKVAPLKSVTLARLELNAAVLLTRLVKKVSQTLNVNINRRYFWTDSTIVLSWLALPSNHWKLYVANRVSEIQSFSSRQEWHHVRSFDNPADLVSRGIYPRQLNNSSLWWHGPEWLIKDNKEWPQSLNINSESDDFIIEQKPKFIINTVKIEEEMPIFTKFSSFQKTQRIIAYCLRFINNARNKTRSSDLCLTCEELEASTTVMIRNIQIRAFPEIFNSNKKQIQRSKLLRLDPFIDSNGLIRVGGRLKHAPINYEHKYPIILPENHHLTKLLITKIHEDQLHAGNQATLAAVRQRFWPLAARNTVRKIIHSCVKCCRARPKLLSQKMGNLPVHRFQTIRPFYNAGVDYAGPFLIKEGRIRSSRKVKAYIALFVCFSTKAVHLELVGDLTTECFIAAFKRFISRRGIVAELFSDNGTNFTGAERHFFKSNSYQNQMIDNLAPKNIKCHFIPARSAHFGGLWERAVRSVKHHLQRVVGDASLTYEEFYTLITCIEACLNSRPITPLSPDPNDLEALTPGHFLIGAPLTAPVEQDVTNVPTNRLSRWQRVRHLQQHFWNRWHKEYLSQLQERPTCEQSSRENIKPGTMVVLVEENLPPLRWKLGRITETHPGNDGLVRVVSVKTVNGVVKRSVKKVCVIPTENNQL